MESGSGAARWGPLEVFERLGGGPSSEVFRARQGRGGPVVALRLLPLGRRADSAQVAAFVRQGEQLAAIEHPHLVKVLSAGIHGGRAGRSMELLDGSSMAQLFDEQGPLAPQELVAIGAALCRALDALHAAGVVHADVRPRNVVRARGMRIVLTDPGADPLPARGAAASVPLAAGAPAFFTAPELLRGDAPSPASDIYALGAVLHLLATGVLPVNGEDLLALRAAHERGARRPVGKLRRDLPPELAAAIDRALEPDPRGRFTGAAEMERALRGEAVPLPAQPPPGRRRRDQPIRLSWTWLALGVVLVAGLAGLWPLLRGEQAVPAPGAPRASTPGADPADSAPVCDARLFRSGRVRDEPLGPSAYVGAGDELYLILAPAEEQFLYVLHRAADGRLAALLPERLETAVAPFAAGRRIRVPPPDGERIVNWRAGAGGVELFVVLGSRERIPLLDAALAGRTPENPLLLDHLALRFVEDGELPPGLARQRFAVAVQER